MNLTLEHIGFSYKSKAFSSHAVFDSVHLSVASGECLAITGEDGTGKSTILQLINGLLKPDSGRMLWNGEDIWATPQRQRDIRKNSGFAFQFPEQQFFCETVQEELMFASRNVGKENANSERECVSALHDLGLDETFLDRSPFSLSMGEARRVALASLIIHQPEVLLLDEPTAGLDAFGFDIVKSLMMRLKSQGRTILFASHEAELICSVASRVVLLAEGRVRNDCSVADFFSATSDT